MPKTALIGLRRRNDLQNMREALRRVGVPEPTINQVVEEEDSEVFTGYVFDVMTTSDSTAVIVQGEAVYSDRTSYGLAFPPNPSQFLTEFIRAQSHPHLRVHFDTKQKPGGSL
jgi:hypothetical protein